MAKVFTHFTYCCYMLQSRTCVSVCDGLILRSAWLEGITRGPFKYLFRRERERGRDGEQERMTDREREREGKGNEG